MHHRIPKRTLTPRFDILNEVRRQEAEASDPARKEELIAIGFAILRARQKQKRGAKR